MMCFIGGCTASVVIIYYWKYVSVFDKFEGKPIIIKVDRPEMKRFLCRYEDGSLAMRGIFKRSNVSEKCVFKFVKDLLSSRLVFLGSHYVFRYVFNFAMFQIHF